MLSFYSKSLFLLCGVILTPFTNPVFGSNFQENSEQQHYSNPNVQKGGDDFYYGRMKSQTGKELWLVMERVDKDNQSLWMEYISVQSHPRAINFAADSKGKDGQPLQKGTTGDGSCHFKRVLNEISYGDNEIWVAYITRAATLPKKITYYGSGFDGDTMFYTTDHLYNKDGLDKHGHRFAKDIEMFVTVTSSPNALITSHMGIATSIEGVRTRQKGTSIDLHSFAAKVMLMRNPKRKYMVNAPVFAMEDIIAKALPDDTFVGTRQMRQTMQQVQGVGQKEFAYLKGNDIRSQLKQKATDKAEMENRSLERKIGQKEGHETKEELRKNAIKYLGSDLVEMGDRGKFIVSKDKIESEYLRELKDRFLWFKNPYHFSPAKMRGTSGIEFLNFMEQHPPIISITDESDQKNFTIFDPGNPESRWLTFNNSNSSDYKWIFDGPFLPAGLTHYMAVDLVALAKSKPLIELDLNIFRNMGPPYSIVISDEDYADSEGVYLDSLKHNLDVVDLTINIGFNIWDETCYNNYRKLISEGLQNKPDLKRLTIVGNFHSDYFFEWGDICVGNENISPEKFLKRSNLKFFANLQELHIEGSIMGANRNDAYFYLEFLRYLKSSKNLKKFTTTDSYYRSF